MDELINKQEVVDLLMERASSLRGIPGDLGGACSGAAKLIMQMPSAEPKRGKWVDDGDPLMLTCGNCGYGVMRYNNTPFCPNCGAKMEDSEDETD